MINEPMIVVGAGFQTVWLAASQLLMENNWETRNLVVQIKTPSLIDPVFHSKIEVYAKAHQILGPKHVAYTIFPHELYRKKGNGPALYAAYNGPRGLFSRKKTGWGTYFRRMTRYEGKGKPVNQLENIIAAIRNRQNLSRAAYTIIIQRPGGETTRPLGGPCLNYMAVQTERGKAGQPPLLALLAVYRNHDFLQKAYGNYWGLCNLLQFLAKEVNGVAGPVTCVSSHAYVPKEKASFKKLLKDF